MTKVFHELTNDIADTVLQHGLLLGGSGEKTDAEVHKADVFLNRYRPTPLLEQGVDRETNNYCYLSSGSGIIDITSGKTKSLKEFTTNTRLALLQIDVDPTMCYVSDLDLYDQVKQLLQNTDLANARRLAHVYWDGLILLANYRGDIHRPEVMVTYNIPPSSIARIN
ncbi:MAG TPA: hypothetical protein VGE13_00405 [Candidatus Saccharimonadales bacterium]